MPYKSDSQRRYFNANRDKLESEGVDVNEWNQSSKGKKLPEKVGTAEFDLGKLAGDFFRQQGHASAPMYTPTALGAVTAGPIVGGLAGAPLGAMAGGLYGGAKGDTVEGIGRGVVRGGLTGAGALTGGNLGRALGGRGGTGDLLALLGALGGGAGGWIGSGKLLGKGRYPEKSEKPEKKEQDKESFDLGKQSVFGAPVHGGTMTPPGAAPPAPATGAAPASPPAVASQPTATRSGPAPAALNASPAPAPTAPNATPQANPGASPRGGGLGGMKIAYEVSFELGKKAAGLPGMLRSSPAKAIGVGLGGALAAYGANRYSYDNQQSKPPVPFDNTPTPGQQNIKGLWGEQDSPGHALTGAGNDVVDAGRDAGFDESQLGRLSGDVDKTYKGFIENYNAGDPKTTSPPPLADVGRGARENWINPHAVDNAGGAGAGMNPEQLGDMSKDIEMLYRKGLDAETIQRLTGSQINEQDLTGQLGQANTDLAQAKTEASPWHANNQPTAPETPPKDLSGIPKTQVQQAGMGGLEGVGEWLGKPGLGGMTRGGNAAVGGMGLLGYMLWKKQQEEKDRERQGGGGGGGFPQQMMMPGGGGGGSRGAFFF